MNVAVSPSDATRIDGAVPTGFRPVRIAGPFIVHNGPLFARIATGGQVQLGFRVQARHTNALGVCHGGMLATFADVLVPCAVLYQPSGSERRYNPTISLQVDYMGAAKLGDWVQGEGQVLRSTRNMLFGQALVTSNGETVLRVSGVYKQGPLINGDRLTDPLGLFSHGD